MKSILLLLVLVITCTLPHCSVIRHKARQSVQTDSTTHQVETFAQAHHRDSTATTLHMDSATKTVDTSFEQETTTVEAFDTATGHLVYRITTAKSKGRGQTVDKSINLVLDHSQIKSDDTTGHTTTSDAHLKTITTQNVVEVRRKPPLLTQLLATLIMVVATLTVGGWLMYDNPFGWVLWIIKRIKRRP